MTSIDQRVIALGKEIRDHAERQDISLTDLAKRAGISRATLYNWLDGERAMPLTGLSAIADVLRVPEYELLHDAEERARRDARTV